MTSVTMKRLDEAVQVEVQALLSADQHNSVDLVVGIFSRGTKKLINDPIIFLSVLTVCASQVPPRQHHSLCSLAVQKMGPGELSSAVEMLVYLSPHELPFCLKTYDDLGTPPPPAPHPRPGWISPDFKIPTGKDSHHLVLGIATLVHHCNLSPHATPPSAGVSWTPLHLLSQPLVSAIVSTQLWALSSLLAHRLRKIIPRSLLRSPREIPLLPHSSAHLQSSLPVLSLLEADCDNDRVVVAPTEAPLVACITLMAKKAGEVANLPRPTPPLTSSSSSSSSSPVLTYRMNTSNSLLPHLCLSSPSSPPPSPSFTHARGGDGRDHDDDDDTAEKVAIYKRKNLSEMARGQAPQQRRPPLHHKEGAGYSQFALDLEARIQHKLGSTNPVYDKMRGLSKPLDINQLAAHDLLPPCIAALMGKDLKDAGRQLVFSTLAFFAKDQEHLNLLGRGFYKNPADGHKAALTHGPGFLAKKMVYSCKFVKNAKLCPVVDIEDTTGNPRGCGRFPGAPVAVMTQKFHRPPPERVKEPDPAANSNNKKKPRVAAMK